MGGPGHIHTYSYFHICQCHFALPSYYVTYAMGRRCEATLGNGLDVLENMMYEEGM